MNSMDIQQFAIPLAAFDVNLLPPGARTVGSAEFQDAVVRYFVDKYVSGDRTAIVSVDDEEIHVVAFPASVRDPMELALGMLHSGKIRDALPILESLSRQRKDDPELFYNLGIAYSEIGEFQDAVMRLKRCIDLDPDHANALIGLGYAYQRLGQSQLAATHLQRAIKIDPTNAYAHRNLGAVLGSGGEHAAALPHLRAARSALPDDPAMAYGLARCLNSIGGPQELQEADQLYVQIIRQFPGTQFDQLAQDARTALAQKTMRDRAVKGLRPDVIYYIADALSTFEREGIERTKQITSEIAILGMNGLDINDPTQKYTLRSLPGNFSGLELLALMYTGFRQIDPGVDAGIDFVKEYEAALALRSEKG